MRPFAGTFAAQMRFTSVSVTTQKTSFRPRRSAASAMAKKVVRSGRSSRLRVCSTTLLPNPLVISRSSRIDPKDGLDRSLKG